MRASRSCPIVPYRLQRLAILAKKWLKLRSVLIQDETFSVLEKKNMQIRNSNVAWETLKLCTSNLKSENAKYGQLSKINEISVVYCLYSSLRWLWIIIYKISKKFAFETDTKIANFVIAKGHLWTLIICDNGLPFIIKVRLAQAPKNVPINLTVLRR